MRVAIAGDSAGANMAAVTALRVRCEGGPPLCGQLLLYSVTDYHTSGTPSYQDNAEGYGLTRDTMKWFWDHYLNDASEAAHPHAWESGLLRRGRSIGGTTGSKGSR